MSRENPGAYLPIDRLHALAKGVDLPATSTGAALFADVSGFTPLTEVLARTLGSRYGAEELARQLNLVYDALVTEAHRFGGSVIGFNGDAITCWFDGDAGLRATACALELHGVLARVGIVNLPTGGKVVLALKVAVASGAVRRFVVGDPALRLFDVLAGSTLDRMAAAEHLAHRAEVVLSPECAPALGDRALVLEWRREAPNDPPCPVVSGLLSSVAAAPWPELPPERVARETLRPWLIPELYEPITLGHTELQPELRPAVALFLRFGGIDYDEDPTAPERLDAYVRWTQQVIDRYGGHLLQLTIGDKGCYFYASFGAPRAHERNAVRAALAALELRSPPPALAFISPVQIGISEGTAWTGAYGGSACRTYGVLGDMVNLAARLMQRAAPGEILVSDQVRRSTAGVVQYQSMPALMLKGKSQPVVVVRMIGTWPTAPAVTVRAAPLVGRAHELQWLRERVAPIFAGHFAGVTALYGEPGIGKSRLVEALHEELAANLTWLTCVAEEFTTASLHPFRRLVGQLLQQSSGLAPEANLARLEAALAQLQEMLAPSDAPELRAQLAQGQPFLAALLGLPAAGRTYERTPPERRLDATLAAVCALLRAEVVRKPLVLYLEDAPWLDADSWALVRMLIRDAAADPLAILMTGRHGEDGQPPLLPLDATTPFATLELGGLDLAAVQALVAVTLDGRVDPGMVTFLADKTSGNPLFVEQLALDLRERGALAGTTDLSVPIVSELRPAFSEEVPVSISGVLMARLDRLPSEAKFVVQLAAVLGQAFDLAVLALLCGDDPRLAAGLEQALTLGIWVSAGEARYRFRHALLRDAAYQTQTQTRLRERHLRAAQAIEQLYGEHSAAHVAELVRHAALAGDVQREAHYLALLGEQAFNLSAFDEAVSCYTRAVALASADDLARRSWWLNRLAQAQAMQGHMREAWQGYLDALALAETSGDHGLIAACCYELGGLALKRGEREVAREQLERALVGFAVIDDGPGQARTLNQLAALYIALDQAEQAVACYERALRLTRRERRGG